MSPSPTTDGAILVAAIDNCIAVSSAAGTLVSFQSDASRVWDAALGMHLVLRIAKNLDAKVKSDQEQKIRPRYPFLPPFETGMHVCDLDADHRVLLNKFNVVNRHILLVSTEFMPQNSTMTQAMLGHVVFCVLALDGLAFHNHGPESGASQPHLHIQVIPRHESDQVPDVPLTDSIRSERDALFDTVGCLRRFPFRHRVVRFRPSEFRADLVERHYHSMLQQLDLTSDSSYNFLLTSEYMMIVPRRASSYQGIGVNSVAFAGLMFFQNEGQLRALTEEVGGPGQFLCHLAYPVGDEADAAAAL